MGNLRLLLAIAAAKLLTIIIKLFGKGGGTAAPGLLALNLEPQLIIKLSRRLPLGSIIISGTNGKTTTSRILSTILSQNNVKIIHNRAGSNLSRGIASTLISHSSLTGKLDKKMAIFEVDEASLVLILKQITPKVLVLTNLFRDQLDRYGEVNTIASKWQKILQQLPKSTTLVLNGDDPVIAHLAEFTKAKIKYYGLEDPTHSTEQLASFADSKYCSYCSSPLDYELIYISHMGKYACPNCKRVRPTLQFYATDINLSGLKGTTISLHLTNETVSVNFALPGLYNVYNVLAAASVAYALKITPAIIKRGLEQFKAAFGRFEKLEVENHPVMLFLVKNPTGFNEVLRTLFSDTEKKQLLIAVNDLIADGRDVSWLWDVDFEKIVDKFENLTVTGLRAYDIGLRLKYAGIDNLKIEADYNAALTNAFIMLKPNQTLYILPTYTAMLELRKKLTKISQTGHFWED